MYFCSTDTQKRLLNLNIFYTLWCHFLSELITIQQQNDSSCEACGREFEKATQLTNLSTNPMQTYEACPFCFTKLNGLLLSDEPEETAELTTKKLSPIEPENQTEKKPDCPHHIGYLKQRPKNAPIPDTCLTCRKMVQCIL